MPKPVSRRELIRKLRALGLEGPISGGRHRFMKKGSFKVRIPNPHHTGSIGWPLLREILRQADITSDQWDART